MYIEYSKGKCTLHIDRLTTDDEAEYLCEAKNDAGIATTWAELLVESKQHFLPSDPCSDRAVCKAAWPAASMYWGPGTAIMPTVYPVYAAPAAAAAA